MRRIDFGQRPTSREELAGWYATALAAQATSGLSVSAYAAQLGVTAATRYQWRRRLACESHRDGDREASPTSLVEVTLARSTLHRKLAEVLRLHVFPPLDPEDIASEVVERGLRSMDALSWSWPELWKWSKQTAWNYRTDLLRAHRAHPVRLLSDPDRYACSHSVADAPNSRAIVEELRGDVDGTQLGVLESLCNEHITNVEMGWRFGVSKRAIESARQELRRKAQELIERDRCRRRLRS